MEASQYLNSKNQNIISKVQSGASTLTVLNNAQVSPVIKIGSSVRTVEDISTQNVLTRRTMRNDKNWIERTGRISLVTLGYYPIAPFFCCTVT